MIMIVSMGIFVNISSSCLTQTGLFGQCINIKKCEPVIQLLKRRPPLKFYNQLRSVHCGFEGTIDSFCHFYLFISFLII
jgi:hypothetical protein